MKKESLQSNDPRGRLKERQGDLDESVYGKAACTNCGGPAAAAHPPPWAGGRSPQ